MPERDAKSEFETDLVKSIRKLPAIYIGGVVSEIDARIDARGLIQYIVCAIRLLNEHKPSFIELDVDEILTVRSDVLLCIEMDSKKKIIPFEDKRMREENGGLGGIELFDGVILSSLSDIFEFDSSDGKLRTHYSSKNGQRVDFIQQPAETATVETKISFQPDKSIFSVTDVSQENLQSYFRELSYLVPRVSFRIKQGESLTEYRSENGARDCFNNLSAPFQILHEPIEVHIKEGDLQVDLTFAIHSWTNNHVWSFVNKRKTFGGGSHEKSSMRAIRRFRKLVNNISKNGILLALIVESPDANYAGCNRESIDDSRLGKKIYRIVIESLKQRITENPDEVKHFGDIERFQVYEQRK